MHAGPPIRLHAYPADTACVQRGRHLASRPSWALTRDRQFARRDGPKRADERARTGTTVRGGRLLSGRSGRPSGQASSQTLRTTAPDGRSGRALWAGAHGQVTRESRRSPPGATRGEFAPPQQVRGTSPARRHTVPSKGSIRECRDICVSEDITATGDAQGTSARPRPPQRRGRLRHTAA